MSILMGDPRRRRAGMLSAACGRSSVLATIVILFGFTLNRYYSDPKAARDDYRGIAEFIVATARPNDAILLVAPGQAEVFDYYYKGDLPVFALPGAAPD